MYAIHVLMFKSHYFYILPSVPVNGTIRCKVHVCMVKILLLCVFFENEYEVLASFMYTF